MSADMMQRSHGAWRDAWRASGLREPAGLLESLIARYEEPHRAYHSLRHIEECFDALAPASALAERLPELQLALWFHDAIYDPRADDNELASAGFARASVVLAGMDAAGAERVVELILATRHESPATLQDARLLADVDLAILAAGPGRFREYQIQIRQEYSFVAPDEFERRRTKILESFLSRPAIYQTKWFSTRLEQNARVNIETELDGIRKRKNR